MGRDTRTCGLLLVAVAMTGAFVTSCSDDAADSRFDGIVGAWNDYEDGETGSVQLIVERDGSMVFTQSGSKCTGSAEPGEKKGHFTAAISCGDYGTYRLRLSPERVESDTSSDAYDGLRVEGNRNWEADVMIRESDDAVES
ncbi:hypothetical protein ACIQEY_15515 [Streptomyces parvus]|uniref:hypothetical protein n=1 Tax=Streptomyces parvus TaxID=66428 RepID=UPI0038015671